MLAKELPANNRLSSLIVPILLVIIIGLAGFIWMTRPQNKRPEPPIQSLVIQQIQGVSELTSAIVNTEQIVEKGENGAGFLWHDRKVLYVAKGKVRIGVNLSEISKDSVSLQGKTVSLMLPPLRVLESELDSEKSYVYSVDAGLIPATQDILNLVRKAQLKAKTQIAEAACSDWVIEAANERIRKTVDQILTPVLKPLGYDATVKTQPLSSTTCSTPKTEANQK